MDKNNTPIKYISRSLQSIWHSWSQNIVKKVKLLWYKWSGIQSYGELPNKQKKYVDMDDVKSEMLMVTTGVPQGSILGPLLFIIYVNDIANASNLFNFIIYADDTVLFTTIEVIQKQYK